ncbi:DNA internalization-related competence protein ComEC/Rec2 [Alteribacillus sp. JSM 102045]|uniref:DNA internalization-related competence protein ComEC/Rec2 n=1 Tax=Alteribacillus sp. JSM 102045 TaxID=1562101 RepID=UPI0035C251B8
MVKNKILFLLGPIAATSLSLTEFSTASAAFAAFVIVLYIYLLRIKMIAFVVVAIIFFVRSESIILSNVSVLTGEESEINGIVTEGPFTNGNRAQLTMKINKKEYALVNVTLKHSSDVKLLRNYSPGISCSVKGKLEAPSPSINFQAFDYSRYLKTKRIHWIQETTLSDLKCKNIELSPGNIIKNWRHYGIQRINDYFPFDLKGMAAALIFGERHFLDPDIEEKYQKLGLIHLLAVSGLHVGLVSGVLYYGLLRLGITKQRAEIVLLMVMPVYIIAAGGAPSVIRAASMVIIFLLLKKINMKQKSFDLLTYLAAGLIFINPYFLLHIGFQLSFTVSGAILLSWKIFQQVNAFFMSFIVTIVAQLAALPIILFHFHEFSILSFVLNFIFIPFITFIVLPFSFILFAVSFLFPYYIAYLSLPFEYAIKASHYILEILSSWNGLQVVSGKPSIFILWCLSFCLYWMFYNLDTKSFHSNTIWSITLIIGVVVIQCIYPYFNKYGYVTILDVGQGDSVVIELPYRQGVYLIDAGGVLQFSNKDWQENSNPYDPGKKIVVPFLKSKGITALDKLIITHGHVDHYGGAYAVAEEFKVKQLLYGEGRNFNKEEKDFLNFIDNLNIPLQLVKSGDSWEAGQSKFQFLLPEGNEMTGNDRSIVFRSEMGGASWLFTGDLEEEGEKKLLTKYPHLRADMLKVGHHGSNTSTTDPFVEQLKSKMAFISAGRCNQFAHPHKETLKTLKAHHIQVFRTDKQGAVEVAFHNNQLIKVKKAVSNPIEVSCN